MRGVSRQNERFQPALLRLDKRAHEARLMRAVTIDHEEHEAIALIVQQASAKVDEHLGSDPSLVQHKKNRPSAATPESMLTPKRCPVLGTVGVRAIGAQVVPAW